MYWTLELASKLEDAPWPATKDELIDYAMRSGAPLEVIENLQEIEDEGEIYECGTCHKKYDNIEEYNACVDTHFNNVNYHYDKYIDLTVVELINSIIDIFNNTGIKELFTNTLKFFTCKFWR